MRNIMCDKCCKELKGWCRAFTSTERALTILEALLIVLLVVFLIFLILHLLVCANAVLPTRDKGAEELHTATIIDVTYPETVSSEATTATETTGVTTSKDTTGVTTSKDATRVTTTEHTTMDPEKECSWTPSAQTTALTHYYEHGVITERGHETSTTVSTASRTPDSKALYLPVVNFTVWDGSEEEEAEPAQQQFVVALVKPRPPADVVFGCLLTCVGARWALTAASCLEAVEEQHALDEFVIMEDYGGARAGPLLRVRDVRVHPAYRGANRSYDLAALRADAELRAGAAAALPGPLDRALLAVGERLHVLGFGPYRYAPRDWRLRRARVWRLAGGACPEGAGAGGWALRHLWAGRPLATAPCAAAWPLCVGALAGRALPCNYCGGAALVRGRLLLGVMADNPACGVACEPQLYVNVAALRDWIDALLLDSFK